MKTFRHDGKCGKKGGKTSSGKTRLCLPQKVIIQLKRTKEGRDALHNQVLKKLRASKGENVQYNPIVLETFREFQKSDTFQDRQKNKRVRTGTPVQIPLFDFDI